MGWKAEVIFIVGVISYMFTKGIPKKHAEDLSLGFCDMLWTMHAYRKPEATIQVGSLLQ